MRILGFISRKNKVDTERTYVVYWSWWIDMNNSLTHNSDDDVVYVSDHESSKSDQSDKQNSEQQYSDQEQNPEEFNLIITSDHGLVWYRKGTFTSNLGFEVRNIVKQ